MMKIHLRCFKMTTGSNSPSQHEHDSEDGFFHYVALIHRMRAATANESEIRWGHRHSLATHRSLNLGDVDFHLLHHG